MLYLLIAVALCLIVPWLPYGVYRILPRRPSSPVSEGELDRLAVELHRGESKATTEPVLVLDESPNPNIMSPDRASPDPPIGESPHTRRGEEERQKPKSRIGGNTRRAVLSRLVIPSYMWVNALLVTVMIGMSFVCTAAWAMLFDYLGESHARTFQPAVFVFKPFSYGIVCGLPAFMLGICTAFPFAFFPARLLLGRSRFYEYLFWEEGRVDPKGGARKRELKGMSCLARCVSVLCVLYVWQAFNWYARVEEDGIAIKRLYSLRERFYPYSSVERITLISHASSGGMVTNLHIQFHDGQVWETDSTFFLPPSPERDRLLDFLRRKTGKEIMWTQPKPTFTPTLQACCSASPMRVLRDDTGQPLVDRSDSVPQIRRQ